MKSFFEATLLASFLLIAFFGFAAMSHGAGHCIASAIQGSVCPTSDLFGFASFHLGFFKSFGSASFESLLLGFAFLSLFVVAAFLGLAESVFSESGRISRERIPNSPTRKVRRWLALFENSPSLVSALG